MSAFIFVFGLVVTVVACGAVGTIWWAALRDGETDDTMRRRDPAYYDEEPPLQRVA